MDGIDGEDGETGPSGMLGSSGIATRVAFWSGVTTLSSDVNLFWDDVNDSLLIGTNTGTAGTPLKVSAIGPDIRFIATGASSNVTLAWQNDGTAQTFQAYLQGTSGDLVWQDQAGVRRLTFYNGSGLSVGTITNRDAWDMSLRSGTGNGFIIGTAADLSVTANRRAILQRSSAPDAGSLLLYDDAGNQMVGLSGGPVTPSFITGGLRIGDNVAAVQKLEVLGHALLDNAGTASQLQFREPSASGTNVTSFKAQVQAADLNYTWPAAIVNQGVLTTDALGFLTWSAIPAGAAGLDGEDGLDGCPGPPGIQGVAGAAIITNTDSLRRLLALIYLELKTGKAYVTKPKQIETTRRTLYAALRPFQHIAF